MGFFDRLKPKARAEPAEKQPAERLTLEGARRADWIGNKSESICAAAARMANTLASAPLHMYKNQEVQREHSLERLVRFSPAPGWNSFSFVRDMEYSRDTVGRAYAWVIRDALRSPLELRYFDAGLVQTLQALETGDVWHRITLPDGRNGYIHDSDMIYLTWLSNAGTISPVSALKGSLEYDSQVKTFSLKQLDGVHDVILISAPSNMSKEKKDKAVNEILETYKATGKNALLLDSGMTATTLSGSPVDPKVLDVDKVTKSRVAGVYGMQSYLLGDGTSNMVNSEDLMQSFLTLTIVPAMAQWEAELNKKLLSTKLWEEGYAFRFDSSDLSRANTQVLADKYFKGIRGGSMKPNEVRKQDGLPPDPNGDELLVSRDLLPLSLIVNHPELLLQGPQGIRNGEGENS